MTPPRCVGGLTRLRAFCELVDVLDLVVVVLMALGWLRRMEWVTGGGGASL